MTDCKTDVINGVDRQKLFATIDAVKANPSLATFKFRLGNSWVDGGENRSTIDGFYGAGQEMKHLRPFHLVNDEPEILLSGDKAPNPVEYVLHALAACRSLSAPLKRSLAERSTAGRSTSRRASSGCSPTSPAGAAKW